MNVNPYASRLNRELIRHVLADVGAIPGSEFGRYALVRPELKISETMDFVFDGAEGDVKQQAPMYAGELTVDGAHIRAIFVDLSPDADRQEYLLVFRNGNNPIYGVRLMLSDPEDDGLFVIMPAGQWVNTTISIKCRALMGLETIVSHGLSWFPCEEIDDLRNAAESLAVQG